MDKGRLRPVLVGASRSCAPGRGKETRTTRRGGERRSETRETEKKKKSNRGLSLAWRIDDASKINVNTTKLVPAVFARGNGISVFTNSIDDISSFSALFFLPRLPRSFSLARIVSRRRVARESNAIRSLSWETRPPEIIGFRGLNYFPLGSRGPTLGKERSHDGNGTD